MSRPENPTSATRSRRAFLGYIGTSVAATSGCLRQTRTVLNRTPPKQVSVTIKTTPAESDVAATRIGRHLKKRLETVGINAQLTLMAEEELYRDILINHDFDLYVARYSRGSDPDFLRPLLHSQFSGEPGWQNPYGFVDLTIDQLLVDQIHVPSSERNEVLDTLQYEIARKQPFTVLSRPNEITAVRADRPDDLEDHDLSTTFGYLSIIHNERATSSESTERLEVTTTDDRITTNFNPLAVEFRDRGPFIDLVYDSLVRWDGTQFTPWLADKLDWDTQNDEVQLTVELRENLRWHDSENLTASDVVFTYRFLKDTSLSDRDLTIPAPRFRGRVSLVSSAEVIDDRTIKFTFGPISDQVAIRSLTIPILPEHIWRSKAEPAEIGGLELFEGTTKALVWNNPDPVGSGPFRVHRLNPSEELVLNQYDDHFLVKASEYKSLPIQGTPVIKQITAYVVPSDNTAVELVQTNQVDATVGSVTPSNVPKIGRSENVSLQVKNTPDFYHIGFNTRHPPASNPIFRRVVSRMLHRGRVVDEIFSGYAEPATSPLSGTKWLSQRVKWDGDDPVLPFIGDDGELDSDQAVSLFEEAGYQMSESGKMLDRST